MHRAPWLLLLTLLCACRGAHPRATALPELPDAFGPIDWGTTAQSLRARFPEALVQESEPRTSAFAGSENGRELVLVEASAMGAQLQPFGNAEIQVMGFQGKPAAVLVIHRSEAHAGGCYGPGSTESQWRTCSERQARERRDLYDRLAAQLTARYGPGTLHPLESEAELTDAAPIELEQSERIWKLPELELRLALGEDPRYHGIMMVRLVASRDARYPY